MSACDIFVLRNESKMFGYVESCYFFSSYQDYISKQLFSDITMSLCILLLCDIWQVLTCLNAVYVSID